MNNHKFTFYFLIIIAIYSLNPVQAERRLIMMGAGGEPNSTSTIFDKGLTLLGNYLGQNNWGEVSIDYNGGHSVTDDLLLKKFKSTVKKAPLTALSWKKTIETYEEQIKSGELKAGDQLLVMINTHGAEKVNELTHSVAVENADKDMNLSNLQGARLVNLDDLKVLSSLAQEKGIQLGILDFSCHSGNTLALANDKTCVISSSGPNLYGNTNFSEDFIKKMGPGKSLEDIFLETIPYQKNDSSFPMISTPEGMTLNHELYLGLFPYLYSLRPLNNNAISNKLPNSLMQMALSEEAFCNRQNNFVLLQKTLKELEESTDKSLDKIIPHILELKKNINTYKAIQDHYLSLLTSSLPDDFYKQEKFKVITTLHKKKYSLSVEYSVKELIETNFDGVINNIYNAKNSQKGPFSEEELEAKVNLYIKVKTRQQEIFKKNPTFLNYKLRLKKELNEQLKDLKDSIVMASRISNDEYFIYSALYTKLHKENNKNNPCRDFVL